MDDESGTRRLYLIGSNSGVVIPGTEPIVSSCTTPPSSCPECHETAAGVVDQGFAGTRASDGSVWIGWVSRQLDYRLIYRRECDESGDPGSCACVVSDMRNDRSRDTLHLARLADGQVEELMALEIPELASRPTSISEVTRSIDMRAYGDRLAIGLQLPKSSRGSFACSRSTLAEVESEGGASR